MHCLSVTDESMAVRTIFRATLPSVLIYVNYSCLVLKTIFKRSQASTCLKKRNKSPISTSGKNVNLLLKSISRYSLFESKRVFWQFEVEGAPDSQKMLEKMLNATVNKFKENTENIQTVVRKVSNLFCSSIVRFVVPFDTLLQGFSTFCSVDP
jgi:hypothetical protein